MQQKCRSFNSEEKDLPIIEHLCYLVIDPAHWYLWWLKLCRYRAAQTPETESMGHKVQTAVKFRFCHINLNLQTWHYRYYHRVALEDLGTYYTVYAAPWQSLLYSAYALWLDRWSALYLADHLLTKSATESVTPQQHSIAVKIIGNIHEVVHVFKFNSETIVKNDIQDFD